MKTADSAFAESAAARAMGGSRDFAPRVTITLL